MSVCQPLQFFQQHLNKKHWFTMTDLQPNLHTEYWCKFMMQVNSPCNAFCGHIFFFFYNTISSLSLQLVYTVASQYMAELAEWHRILSSSAQPLMPALNVLLNSFINPPSNLQPSFHQLLLTQQVSSQFNQRTRRYLEVPQIKMREGHFSLCT